MVLYKNLLLKMKWRKYQLRKTRLKCIKPRGGSQLLDEVFTADLGRFGEGPYTNAVLDGAYIPPVTATLATVDFLQVCKRPQNCETS